MNDIYTGIEEKYGFAIPREYRAIAQLGWFDASDSNNYFWLHEAEWLSPQAILEYEPQDYHKPWFVPFAFTGAGDHWCWWPRENAVVLCPHDVNEGEFDAPDFLGFVYRRTLDYAGGGFVREDEVEARAQLCAWADRLTRFFPPQWLDRLRALADAPLVDWQRGRMHGFGFLTLDAYEEIVRRDLGFDKLDQSFEWMSPYTGSPSRPPN